MGDDYRKFCAGGVPGGSHMICDELDCYLTAEEFMLFNKFCKYANKHGNSDIRVSATDAGMSDRTYRRTLGRLRSIGVIKTKRDGKRITKQIDFDAVMVICEIFQTFGELRNRIREFVGTTDVMSITDDELNDYVGVILGRKKDQ